VARQARLHPPQVGGVLGASRAAVSLPAVGRRRRGRRRPGGPMAPGPAWAAPGCSGAPAQYQGAGRPGPGQCGGCSEAGRRELPAAAGAQAMRQAGPLQLPPWCTRRCCRSARSSRPIGLPARAPSWDLQAAGESHSQQQQPQLPRAPHSQRTSAPPHLRASPRPTTRRSPPRPPSPHPAGRTRRYRRRWRSTRPSCATCRRTASASSTPRWALWLALGLLRAGCASWPGARGRAAAAARVAARCAAAGRPRRRRRRPHDAASDCTAR
jgi:hypothetical protein